MLDATTGQNAVNQTKEFKTAAGITGIVLTKLDGTAKGGVVLAIKEELDVPVKYIGVGEQIDDLQPFEPDVFARALFGGEEPAVEETDEAEQEVQTEEDELRPSTADIWAQIDAEAAAEKENQPEEEEIKPTAEELEKQKEAERLEKEKRAEERKNRAKSKYNWSTTPAASSNADDDDWYTYTYSYWGEEMASPNAYARSPLSRCLVSTSLRYRSMCSARISSLQLSQPL